MQRTMALLHEAGQHAQKGDEQLEGEYKSLLAEATSEDADFGVLSSKVAAFHTKALSITDTAGNPLL